MKVQYEWKYCILSYLKPQNCILMEEARIDKLYDDHNLLIHSIDDEAITRQRVCGIYEVDVLFITVTSDYRYLMVVANEFSVMGLRLGTFCLNIYVMDLLSRKWQFRRCGIDLLTRGTSYFAVSRKWNDAEVALIVDGFLRELHLSHNENARVLPVDIHNVIANYISIPEELHYIGKGVHFAISIEDILLERLDYEARLEAE